MLEVASAPDMFDLMAQKAAGSGNFRHSGHTRVSRPSQARYNMSILP